MTISTTADAVAARDKAAHLMHLATDALAKASALLLELDAYIAPIIDGGSGTVKKFEGGTNKPPV